jgi:DNA-binding NarL/FixJ family response regulator
VIRVLVADDQRLVRAGFGSILGGEPDVTVVAEAGDGAEAVRLATALHPDVVLMDVRMPGVDGIEAARRLAADPRTADVRVVVLTTFDLDEYVYAALRAGARGFLLKDVEPRDLLQAVRVVAAGEALLSPTVTGRLLTEFAARTAPPDPAPALARLTDREREVVALVGEGLSNEEIAARTRTSPATAKTHVSRAMTKLHVRDRAQLVVLAYEAGAVLPRWARPRRRA